MTSTPPGASRGAQLRIAVIAHALRQGGGLSAGRSLVESLVSSSSHKYLFTLPDLREYRTIPFDPARHEVVFYRRRGGMVGRWMYDTFRLEKRIRGFGPDRILALGNRGIHDPPCAQAVFSRDAHMFYPASHFGNETLGDKLKMAYQRRRFVRDLRHTHLVFCQTEVARDRLQEMHDFKGKIAIAGNAISAATIEGAESRAGRSGNPGASQAQSHSEASSGASPRSGPSDEMRLLCLGSYYPHKNLEAVVDMFERHEGELEGVVVLITIAPDQHVSARRLLDRIRKAGLEDRIQNLGPLSQEEIGDVFRSCHALFLPTLLESFSRTYLEAMQFGVPILTSDFDFARGICADAALYFDAFSTESTVAAVRRLRDDAAMAADLVAKGKGRLDEISQTWDQIATGVLSEVEVMTKTGGRE